MSDLDSSNSEQEPARTIRSRALESMRWSALSRVSVQLIQFASQVALARLLVPEQFGYAALALVVGNFALLLSDFGIGAALVHGNDLTQRRLDTAFWMNAVVGASLTVVIAFAAQPVANVVGEPQAAGPMRFAGFVCLVAVYAVPLALMERRIELRIAGSIEAVSTLVGAITAVLTAVAGLGAYAVVAMPFATALCNSVLYLINTRYRPRAFVHWPDFVSIFRYSRGLLGFNIVNYFGRNVDNVLIGRFDSSTQLGFYTRAYSLMLLPVTQVQFVLGRVLFPALTRLNHDLPRLRQAHRRSLVLSSLVCAPLSMAAAATSPDLIETLLGSQWLPAAPMLTILSLVGIQQVFQGTVGILYQATGRTALMFRWNLAFTAFTLAAFAVGINWGAIGICWAVFTRGWALLPISLAIPLHLIGDTLRGVFRSLAPVAIGLLAEGLTALGALALLTPLGVPSPLRLLAELTIGGLFYILVIRALAPTASREFVALIRPRRDSTP